MPLAVDHVNAYLLPGDPLTLIDAGPRAAMTLSGLERALADEGVRIEDIRLLILTHEHEDHVGLAGTVARRSGCGVAAQPSLADMLKDPDATRAVQDAYRKALISLHGGPPEELVRVAEASAFASSFSAPVEVTVPLRDGKTITAGGYQLTVHRRPGHSPTDTILVDTDGWALVADHLSARGRTLAVAHRPPEGTDPSGRPPGLLLYRESLAKTAALGLRRAFPGHGSIVEDPANAIARQLELQDERARQIFELLGSRPRPAWQLVELTHRRRPTGGHLVSEGFIQLSDVLAHLDLLVANGLVQMLEGDVIRYVRSPQ